MFNFILAVVVLVATPGPALMSIVGVGAAFGFKVGVVYVAGVILGANFVSLLAVSGLFAFLTAFPRLQFLLTTISVCYLCYIAYRIATSKVGLDTTSKPVKIGLSDGIVIQLLNPKACVIALALFSGSPFLDHSLKIETILKFW